MALNVDLQVLTQPGATGQQTYSLPSGFDPKMIKLWAVPGFEDGTDPELSFGEGYGTYRGGVVQQGYVAIAADDAVAAVDAARASGRNAVLKLLQPDGAVVDLEIDLVSMQGGATSQVVLDWVNLHTTASIRVFMLVLGGDDLTDAMVGDFVMPTAATSQTDIEVVAGFGQPDLVFFANAGQQIAAGASSDSQNTDVRFGVGFAKKGEEGRGFGYRQRQGAADSEVEASQRSDRCIVIPNHDGAGNPILGRLSTTLADWPTDGFEVLGEAPGSGTGRQIIYVALRFSADVTITTGADVAPIAGSPPVVQDLAAGNPPKLGLVMGWSLVAQTTVRTTDADLIGFGIGAYDGDQEAWAGVTDDDAAASMRMDSQQTTAKVFQNWVTDSAGNPQLQSEADGAFSGNNFRLSWGDIDTVERQYQWLTLAEAAGGPAVVEGAFSVGVTTALTASGVQSAAGSFSAGVTMGLEAAGLQVTAGEFTIAETTALEFAGEAFSLHEGAFSLGASTSLDFAGVVEQDGEFSLGVATDVDMDGSQEATGAFDVGLQADAAFAGTRERTGAFETGVALALASPEGVQEATSALTLPVTIGLAFVGEVEQPGLVVGAFSLNVALSAEAAGAQEAEGAFLAGVVVQPQASGYVEQEGAFAAEVTVAGAFDGVVVPPGQVEGAFALGVTIGTSFPQGVKETSGTFELESALDASFSGTVLPPGVKEGSFLLEAVVDLEFVSKRVSRMWVGSPQEVAQAYWPWAPVLPRVRPDIREKRGF